MRHCHPPLKTAVGNLLCVFVTSNVTVRNWQLLLYCFVLYYYQCSCFVVYYHSIPQSLAKLTVNFQSSLSISDSASEVANSTGTVGDLCNLQQYCDTGCQTDIMGEVGDSAAPPCLYLKQRLSNCEGESKEVGDEGRDVNHNLCQRLFWWSYDSAHTDMRYQSYIFRFSVTWTSWGYLYHHCKKGPINLLQCHREKMLPETPELAQESSCFFSIRVMQW